MSAFAVARAAAATPAVDDVSFRVEAGEVVVAYEPVWAIGTGLTPTRAEIGEMHALIRRTLPKGEVTRLLLETWRRVVEVQAR